MIPTKQLIRHDPENGQYGDCHRACIASILEIPIERVPHFGEDGPKDGTVFWKRINDFLYDFGMVEVQFAFEAELEAVQNMMKLLNPSVYYILGCKSRSGYPHSVICFNGEIVHEPTLSNPPYEYNKLNGFYWIGILAQTGKGRNG